MNALVDLHKLAKLAYAEYSDANFDNLSFEHRELWYNIASVCLGYSIGAITTATGLNIAVHSAEVEDKANEKS